MARELPIAAFAKSERQSKTLALKPSDAGLQKLSFELPDDLLADSLKIELTASSSPAKTLFGAIPFLIDYPYGCVEQTMSRFYPLAIAADALRQQGLQAEQLKQELDRHKQSAPQRMPAGTWGDNLLSSAAIDHLADEGLLRLYRFQHQDGGWGWWADDRSSPFMTAYVLVGLRTAQRSGISVRADVIDDGRRYLASSFRDGGNLVDESLDAQELAYVVYALSLLWSHQGSVDDDSIDDAGLIDEPYLRERNAALRVLVRRRAELNYYGRCLLALALHNSGKRREAVVELNKLIAEVQVDGEMAALPVGDAMRWQWKNNAIEINAWLLRALLQIKPNNPLNSQVVQWLVNHRHHGTYWHSTRDSALAVLALSEYLAAEKLQDKRIEFDYWFDELPPTHVSALDLPLSPESSLTIDPLGLKPGVHTLTIRKPAEDRLHVSLVADYQRSVKTIPAANNGIAIERSYLRIKPAAAAEAGAVAEPGAPHRFAVGDIIEIELRIRTQRDYEYLAFEDPKPAGCEPLQLQSGSAWENGLWENVELRDEKVVFFASALSAGEHVLRYKLRAETPGVFRAMPASGFAMYTPDICGNTMEQVVVIEDAE